jgi:adenosylhomocysteine nucleosidase
MLLRWLVNNYLRDAAEQAVRQTISQTMTSGERAPSDGAISAQTANTGDDASLNCEIALMFALGMEASPLVDKLQDAASTKRANLIEHAGTLLNRLTVIAESGVGPKAAAAATRDIIRGYEPKWIISAGFAGSLNEQVRRGHMVMASSVANVAGETLEIGLGMQPTEKLHTGRLLTVDGLIRTASEKRSVGAQHQAIACDMETFAVAQECQRAGVKFLSVRIISDGLDDELPKEIDKLMKEKNLAKQAGIVVHTLMKRPGAALDFWKLREEANKAADRLAKFLLQVIPQLPVG